MSTKGYKYYIHFVDDYYRLTTIYPLRKNSNALSTFKAFQTLVEKQFSKSILCVQTDFGGEYRPFEKYLVELGIRFKHPCL